VHLHPNTPPSIRHSEQERERESKPKVQEERRGEKEIKLRVINHKMKSRKGSPEKRKKH
jgi:hypothetical protein